MGGTGEGLCNSSQSCQSWCGANGGHFIVQRCCKPGKSIRSYAKGGRAPALVKLVMWLGEELEVRRDKILPRGFRSPFGPSLERRIFQASHKIVLTTTQFNAGIPVVSSSSYIGIILSAFLTLRRKRAMSLTKVWMDWRSWLEGFSRERREGIRMHP